MDFSLTHLIVVPSANTLPTSGTTSDLTPGQVGIYTSAYVPATVGTIPSQPYIYIAQGRADTSVPSLRSDKVSSSQTYTFTKVSGGNTAVNEQWVLSGFNVQKGQPLTLSINAHSFYLDTAFNNGYSKSVVVNPSCFQCTDSTCDTVPNEAVIDAIIAKVYQDFNYPTRQAGALAQFFSFVKLNPGGGASAQLQITALPLTQYGQPCDLAAFPFLFDRLWFRPFVYQGPDTTADMIVADACNVAATITCTQRSDYAKLTYAEVVQLEKDYYSYKVPRFKEIFRFGGYTPTFESYAEAGQVYNQYLIEFGEYDKAVNKWLEADPTSSRVILLVPNGITNIETLLTAYLGAPTQVGGTQSTTSTSTSSSSTSTTTTTSTLIP